MSSTNEEVIALAWGNTLRMLQLIEAGEMDDSTLFGIVYNLHELLTSQLTTFESTTENNNGNDTRSKGKEKSSILS